MAQSSRYSTYSTYSSDSGGSPGGSPNCSASSHSRSGRTYMCKVCGHLFASGQSLGGHMNVHRKDTRGGARSPGRDNHNASSSSSSSSPPQYKGVRHRKEQNKWVAEIRPPRATKTWWLGTYSTPEEAAYAYDVAITYFGSESSLNFEGHPTYEQIPRIAEDLPNQDFAAELRKVVKKYGKLAMASGAVITDRDSNSACASADADNDADASELLLPWEDFSSPSLHHDEYLTGFGDFDVPASFPEPSFQLPWYDPPESAYPSPSYYGYGYEYSQHSHWPPHSGPMDR